MWESQHVYICSMWLLDEDGDTQIGCNIKETTTWKVHLLKMGKNPIKWNRETHEVNRYVLCKRYYRQLETREFGQILYKEFTEVVVYKFGNHCAKNLVRET